MFKLLRHFWKTIRAPRPRCEAEGCYKKGDLYLLTLGGEATRFHYCNEHCGEAGFCSLCGKFFLGIDDEIEEIGVCASCRQISRRIKRP